MFLFRFERVKGADLETHISVKELPESERPYEKFLRYGVEALSDAELLAVIIKTGTRDLSALDLARGILSCRQGNLLNLYELSFERLCEFPGIGKVKAIQLKVIAELSRRIAKTDRGYQLRLNNPLTIAEYYMEELRHLSKEILVCAYFDAKCTFLGDEKMSVGSTTYAYISPKDIFHGALIRKAVQIVLLHNHPSGDPTPSQDDILVTQRIREGALLLDLKLSDHIIIGDNRYFSFTQENL